MSAFCHLHRVTYSECTLGNHIYYSRYLDLLEEARGEFLRHLGCGFLHWQQEGTIFPVMECRIRYKASARYDDLLRIEVWPTLAAGARFNISYRIRNEAGTLIIEAETYHVCTGLDEKPKRMPKELCASLRAYLEPTPITSRLQAREGKGRESNEFELA